MEILVLEKKKKQQACTHVHVCGPLTYPDLGDVGLYRSYKYHDHETTQGHASNGTICVPGYLGHRLTIVHEGKPNFINVYCIVLTSKLILGSLELSVQSRQNHDILH